MSGTWNSITHFQPKDIGGANTIKDLEIGGAIATAGIGGLGLAGVDVLGGLGAGIGAGVDGLGTALGFGADAGAAGAGAAGGLVPGSLDALAATGNLAGTIPAGVGAAGIAAPAGAEAALGFVPDATAAGAALPAGATPTAANATDLAFSGGADPVAGLGGANPAAISPAGQGLTAAGQLGAATPTAPGAGGGGFLDTLGNALSPSNIAGGIGKSITSNPLGLALGAGGLGYSIFNGQKQTAADQALAQQAQQSGALGNQLSSYLTSGTLPPGLQAGVTSAVQNAKAAAISNAAHNGQSTDPTQNTALAQQLAAIDAQTPQLTAQIGQQLLQGGQAASGLSSQTYSTLANIDQTQTAAVGKAIANMAAALSGKSGVSTPAGSFTFSPGASA